MKLYEPYFPNISNRFSLQEAIINPNNYLKDIYQKVEKILNKITNKKYNPKKLCTLFSIGLARYIPFNFEEEYENIK